MIDTTFVISNSINNELVLEATNNPADIQKLIDYIDKKIFICVDRELFSDWEDPATYTYPEDLQLAEMYLLENLFEYRKVEWQMKFHKSIKIDDVTEIYKDIETFWGIPTNEEIGGIINSYCDSDIWYQDISFSNYDI